MNLFRKIGELKSRIEYRRMRANYKLAPEDWWEFKYTLANIIEQGIDNLLHQGIREWDADWNKQKKEDLEFILEWAREFPQYESGIMATDAEDFIMLNKKFGDEVFIFMKDDVGKFEKKTRKAFGLLAKNIHNLWG